MRQKMKQLMGILLSISLMLGLMPGMSLTAYADGTTYNPASMYTGFGDLISNDTEVTISEVSGKTWYVIACGDSTVTLLSKQSFAKKAFNSSGIGNDYTTSEIKTYVDELTGEGQPLEKISSVISDLTLIDITTAQGLSETKRKGDGRTDWWLCSQGGSADCAAFVDGDNGSVDDVGFFLDIALGVRPALKLNLESVFFSSETKTFTMNLYASLKNTTTEISFDGKSWYLTDYDDTTVTLLSKECVASSEYNESGRFVEYSQSTVKTAVDNWYNVNITADAQTAVSGGEMFLLTFSEAIAITNADVRKCTNATNGGWWLCSQGNDVYDAVFVDYDDGYVYGDGSSVSNTLGVRPALKLNLSSVIFESESKTFSLKPYAEYDVTTPANRDKGGDDLKALQVKFNEKSWYIIANNSTAVDAGTVTLLAAESFGTSKFHDSSNAYSTSTIRTTLYNMTDSGSFAGVASAINTVKVKGSDSDTEVDAKLYLLNTTEAKNVPENVRKFSDDWWLCSRGGNVYNAAFVFGDYGGVNDYGLDVDDTLCVRPALKLNLSSVIFESESKTFSLKPYADYDVTTPANKDKSGEELTALQVKFNEKSWYIIADNSTAVSAGTVTLLAADTTFGTKTFDDVNYSNKYSTSQVKTYLDSMTGTDGAFADVADAIETVNLTTNQYKSNDVYETVNNVKLYLLSTEEAKSLPENVCKAEFTGGDCNYNEWWLRSPGYNDISASFVYGDDGYVTGIGDNVLFAFGVRPALKLNLSSVIFSSVNISGGKNAKASGGSIIQNYFDVGTTRSSMTAVTYTANSGYKFPETSDYYTTTNGIKVERTSDTVVTVSGTPTANTNITIPDAHAHSFTYSASGATITATCTADGCDLPEVESKHVATLTIAANGGTYDGTTAYGATITDVKSIQGDAKVQYQKKTDGSYGTATETAPKDAGDYKASITVGSATASVEYTIAKADPSVPTGLTATIGQTLANVTLPDGWTWADSTQSVGNVVDPTATFKANFTGNDNYNAASNVDVTVTVGKANAVAATVTANNRTYDGTEKPLVTVTGEATGGEMQYALGTVTEATEQYTTSIPTATEAGTYYVWYRVKGDAYHKDTDPESITVRIAEKGSGDDPEQEPTPEPEPEPTPEPEPEPKPNPSPVVPEAYKATNLSGLTIGGMSLDIRLYGPRNTVSYNGRTHVAKAADVAGKRNKVTDLDISIEGAPGFVVADFIYGKTKDASEGKAWFAARLSPNKSSASFNALSAADRKKLESEIKKANKALKKKANRVYFSIRPLDLGEFKAEGTGSGNGKVFVRKDGSGDKLVLKTETSHYIDPVTHTVKGKGKPVLHATLSGYEFRVPRKEYKKTGPGHFAGKGKNLVGTVGN